MTRHVNPQKITDVEADNIPRTHGGRVDYTIKIFLVNNRVIFKSFDDPKERDALLVKIRNNVSHLVEI